MYVTSSGVLTVDKTPNIADRKNKQNVQNINRTLSDYLSKLLKYYMYFLSIWNNYAKQVTNKNKRARHIHVLFLMKLYGIMNFMYWPLKWSLKDLISILTMLLKIATYWRTRLNHIEWESYVMLKYGSVGSNLIE